MKRGHWIPFDERALALLPKDRAYTKLEALMSLQADIHHGNIGSIAGYASLWGWSRDKVRRFITPLKEGIDHFVDRKPTGNRHPIRICFKELDNESDTKPTLNRHKNGTTIRKEEYKKNKSSFSHPSPSSKNKGSNNEPFPVDEIC